MTTAFGYCFAITEAFAVASRRAEASGVSWANGVSSMLGEMHSNGSPSRPRSARRYGLLEARMMGLLDMTERASLESDLEQS